MKKKILSLLLTLTISVGMLGVMPITASAASGTCGDNLTWTLDNEGTLNISGTGDMWNYDYASVPWYDYRNRYISSVVIETGVTSIGSYAFYNCRNLSNVMISGTVKTISNNAFMDCTSLNNITIPYNVTAIGYGAFSYSGITEIFIPGNVSKIDVTAFQSCDKLKSITVSENNINYLSDNNGVLYSKDKKHLIKCPQGTQMETYTVPASVVNIYNSAFDRCTDLRKIFVNESNSVFSSDDSGVLFNKQKTVLYKCPAGNISTSYSIPATVQGISAEAFASCDNLETVNIPGSVKNLGMAAFRGCGKLFEVSIEEGIEVFPSMMFAECVSLKSIELPLTTKRIMEAAFKSCVALESIKLPPYLETIGAEAFAQCYSLKSLTLPEKITVISNGSFAGCQSLERVIIPKGVTKITGSAFSGCGKLSDVYYSGSESEWGAITIDAASSSVLSRVEMHYNYVDGTYESLKNKVSQSTSPTAPVIKSVQLDYNMACYDIVNQTVLADVGSAATADIYVDIDWKNATHKKVYITQGGTPAKGQGLSLDLSNSTGEFKNVALGAYLKPDMPVYVFAIDELTGKSSSVQTKLEMVDLAADEEYQKMLEAGVGEIKLGKNMEFSIPDDVPLIGGMDLKWAFSPVPITVSYQEDGKLAMTIGFKAETEKKNGVERFKNPAKFRDFKTAIDDYRKSLDKYGDNIADAYKKQNRTLKQLRSDFRLFEANTSGSKHLTMSAWGGKILKSTGSGGFEPEAEAIGYAEVPRKNGELDWGSASGYVMLKIGLEYEYNGQSFIWVIPVCYSFGGGVSVGGKLAVNGMSEEGYAPNLDAYFMSELELFVSGGVGVSKVANFNAKAAGDLKFNYAIGNSEGFDELLLDGSVDFNVVLLGQTVASLEVANLNDKYGVIYSNNPDKYEQSWIKPGEAQSMSVMSIDEQLDCYSADKVYEAQSRDYLDTPMKWLGEEDTVSIMSADYTNKYLSELAANVYTEAQPEICDINGTKVMVFTTDDGTRNAQDRQMLVYSVYDAENKTWSAPLAVEDDKTADFYPSIQGEYLVWQNQKAVSDEGSTLAEVGKKGEIMVSKWNGTGFDEPFALTDNDGLDTLPKAAVDGDALSVVWLRNTADDILGVEGETSIVTMTFDGETWGEETVLKDGLNAVTDLSIGYCDGVLNVAYTHDTDGDIVTNTDREVYLINENETRVTENEVLDSNTIINNGKLYWYSENNIHFMNISDGSVSTVFDDERFSLSDGFTVSENNGNIAVLWSGTEGEGSEIKGVLYQNGEWGDVIDVSELGMMAKYPTCVLEADGTILASFTAENDDMTSLYTLGLIPSYDLAITDVYFDESKLVPNSEQEIQITVANNGEIPVSGFEGFISSSNISEVFTFDEEIKAGAYTTVTVPFTVGDTIVSESLCIELVLTDGEEYDYENNSAFVYAGNGDIEVSEVAVYETLPTSYAAVSVTNRGYSDISNITVALRKENDDGEIVTSEVIEALASGESREIILGYNPQDYENTSWCVSVESENVEASYGNNIYSFINECAVGLENLEHSILNYSLTDGVLNINTYAKSNISDITEGSAYAAVYDKDGILKGIAGKALYLTGYRDTGIDMWLENYTYAEGDTVKIFIWNSGMQALCDTDSMDIVL